MGDHNGKVGIEQKIYILPQNREKKNFVSLASSGHKVFFSLFCGKKYTYPHVQHFPVPANFRGENFFQKRYANNQSSRGAWNARKALNMRVSYYFAWKTGRTNFFHPENYFFTLASLGRKNNFPGGKKFFSPFSMQVIYLSSC